MDETTRFTLEEKIMAAWGTADDLQLLYAAMLDGPEPMTPDQIANALLGIKSLHEMRSKELFKTFETLIENGKLADERITHDSNGVRSPLHGR